MEICHNMPFKEMVHPKNKCGHLLTLIFQNIFFHVPQKKIIHIWKDLRVSKWWQHVHFSVNYPSTTVPIHYKQCGNIHLKSNLCTSTSVPVWLLSMVFWTQQMNISPGGHHIWKPNAPEVLGHFPVDLIKAVFLVWDEHLLHDGELRETATTHLHELHESAAGDLALAQSDGRQVLAALCDTNQLLIQRPQTVGTHRQLHQTWTVHAHASQDIFADRAAEVEVRNGDLVTEKGPKLVLVQEEIHDQVEFGRMAHHGVPAALLDGVELLAGVLAHHVYAQMLEVHVLLRGQRQQQLVAQ